MGSARSHRLASHQVALIVGASVLVWFLVAFTAKAVDAWRLRTWRDELQGEITAMQRERDALRRELDRRQTYAWVDEQLRDAGLVPEGVVSVMAVPASPAATEGAEAAPRSEVPAVPGVPVGGGGAFDNPNWEAWQQLIWGFDTAP